MSFTAGEVRAILGGEFNPAGFSRFEAAMRQAHGRAEAAEKGISASMQRTSRAMSAVGTVAKAGLGAGILGAGLAIGKSVKAAADFEQQLSSLKSVSGASAREMRLLRDDAMRMGAATKYSALEAAKAQTELAKGGLSTSQILKGGLKSALTLAAAGELELADAASYTVNAMKLFGLQGKESVKVADAFATAANITTADVQDFGAALTQGGSAAKQAGYSFSQTTTILAALAEIGVKNSDAGTSMKAALLQLINPTDKQAEAAKKAGISFLDQKGRMKDVAQISDMLREKTEGMTKAQRTALFQTLAGSDGFRTLAALYDQGPKKIEALERSLQRQGTAAEVAAAKQDNFKGKLEAFQGSLETAAIAVGTQLLPGLTRLATDGAAAVERFAASGDFERIGQGIASGGRVAVDVFGDIVQVGGDVVGVVADVNGALQSLTGLSTGTELKMLLAGLVAFKAAKFVAPLIGEIVGAMRLLATAPTAGALFKDLAKMVGPLRAVAIAAGVAGAAIALLASKESAEEAAARRSAEAKREQLDALRALREAERGSVDTKLAAQRATLDVENAEKRLSDLRKSGVKKSSLEYREAELDLTEALNRQISTRSDYEAQLRSERGEREKTRREANEGLKVAAEEKKAADEQVRRLEKIASKREDPRVQEELAAAKKRAANAQRDVNEAMSEFGRLMRVTSLGDLNKQRLEAGVAPISRKNAADVQFLAAALAKLPKKVQTRYLLDGDQAALARIGQLSARLLALGKEKVVTRILTEADSSNSAATAMEASLAGVPDKRIVRILADTGNSKDEVTALRSEIERVKSKRVKLEAEAEDALGKIARVRGEKIASKVARIVGQDGDARTKIQQLRALGIPAKTARLLAENLTAGGVNAALSDLARIPASKTTIVRIIRQGAKAVSDFIGGEASGGGGTARTALIGEGRAGEWRANARTGELEWIGGPQVRRLAADDFIIPTEARYRGNATGLLEELAQRAGGRNAGMLATIARSLGMDAFAGGRRALDRGKARKKVAKLPVPDAVSFGAVPDDELRKDVDDDRNAYTKRQASIASEKKKVRAAEKRVNRSKGEAKKRAQKDLSETRARLRALQFGGGPNKLRSLQSMYEEYLSGQKQLKALQAKNRQLERWDEEQQVERQKMENASQKGDQTAWKAARDRRSGLLEKLRDAYQQALGLAKADSIFRAQIEGKLQTSIGDLQDLDSGSPAADAARELAESGMTAAERQQLEQLRAGEAIAALTEGLDDDRTAADATTRFFEQVFQAVQADPARGGAGSVREIAEQLKAARDKAESLRGGSGGVDDPNLQAQLERERERAEVARAESAANVAALRAFTSSADIGTGRGGGSALGAAMQPVTVEFRSYVPPSPQQARELGEYVTEGLGYQQGRRSTVETVA